MTWSRCGWRPASKGSIGQGHECHRGLRRYAKDQDRVSICTVMYPTRLASPMPGGSTTRGRRDGNGALRADEVADAARDRRVTFVGESGHLLGEAVPVDGGDEVELGAADAGDVLAEEPGRG